MRVDHPIIANVSGTARAKSRTICDFFPKTESDFAQSQTGMKTKRNVARRDAQKLVLKINLVTGKWGDFNNPENPLASLTSGISGLIHRAKYRG